VDGMDGPLPSLATRRPRQVRSEIAEATRSKLLLLRTVEADIVAGITTTQMTFAAARERLRLADGLLSVGNRLLAWASSRQDIFCARSAIARYYYAMFQAARAVVFIDVGGDDYNAHQELPKKLPNSFPNRAYWVNELKNARLRRNDADYDPYPNTFANWLPHALNSQTVATDFVRVADAYLTLRGV